MDQPDIYDYDAEQTIRDFFLDFYGYELSDTQLDTILHVKRISAETKEALAKAVFPVSGDMEILRWVERHARPAPEGWEILRPQTMAVMGWDPSQIRWEMLEKLGVDW